MKNLVNLMFLCIVSLAFVSCDSNDDEPTPTPLTPQEKIVGSWICHEDAYGDLWEKPLIYYFDADGTGYQWFQEEAFSDRWTFTYSITESKLRISTKFKVYNLTYTLSENGKSLIIYGWDDNDMETLRFTKQ